MNTETARRSTLEARLTDALYRAQGGTLALLPFLTPKEAMIAKRLLCERGALSCAYFFGGYKDAERVCLFLLPDYLLACLDAPIAQATDKELEDLLGEDIRNAVAPLRITGSGFCTLTHRDYLGAIMGLGLERDAIGDVAIQNDREAVVFCSATIRDFLCQMLETVGKDHVRCRPWQLDESFTDGKKYQPIHDTVASARLDCVVAALANLSREAAQGAIRSGLVELNFEPAERNDLSVEAPATVSIRGHGRFFVRSLGGETRKGRIRLFAEKLI